MTKNSQKSNFKKYSHKIFLEVKNNSFWRVFGFILGANIPYAVFKIMHDKDASSHIKYLALGGLLYSGIKVSTWAYHSLKLDSERKIAKFASVLIALGFTAILEAILSIYHGHVAYLSLFILMIINGISASTSMANWQIQKRKKKSKGKK